jgi:leucyl aminopeptidase (aminopeptidase T)
LVQLHSHDVLHSRPLALERKENATNTKSRKDLMNKQKQLQKKVHTPGTNLTLGLAESPAITRKWQAQGSGLRFWNQ